MARGKVARFFLPRTRLGLFSIICILIFFFLVVLIALIARIQGPRENQTFLDNLLLFIPGILIVISGVSAFFTGLIGIIKKKERSFFVYISTLVGLFVLWFLIGEIFVSH